MQLRQCLKVFVFLRRQLNIEQRRERQEKRDRKELVERLLAEHEAREQAEREARYATATV